MTLLEGSRLPKSFRRRPVAEYLPTDGGEALLPWYAFESAIDRSLAMLRGVHIPLSLFVIRSHRIIQGETTAAIAAAWCRFGTMGRMPDASIGLLYLGPHERHGDAALLAHLRREIERLMPAFDLAVAQCWSDELDGASDLLHLLAV